MNRFRETAYRQTDISADGNGAMGKFETVLNCYQTRLAGKAGLTHVAFDKVSIHEEGREVAEVTSHDFRPRTGKKDGLASMR